MAYLGTIVRHLEDTFHVKVHGQFHTRTEIEGTRFLTQKPDTDPDHGDKLLYIACSQTAAPSGCPEAAFSAGVFTGRGAILPSAEHPVDRTGDTPGRPPNPICPGSPGCLPGI